MQYIPINSPTFSLFESVNQIIKCINKILALFVFKISDTFILKYLYIRQLWHDLIWYQNIILSVLKTNYKHVQTCPNSLSAWFVLKWQMIISWWQKSQGQFLAGKTAIVAATSMPCRSCCVLFCKIQARQRSWRSYLLWLARKLFLRPQ